MYPTSRLTGDADGACGGLVSVESLGFSKYVQTLAHGSFLPEKVEVRT
jgi:hypothetical protein